MEIERVTSTRLSLVLTESFGIVKTVDDVNVQTFQQVDWEIEGYPYGDEGQIRKYSGSVSGEGVNFVSEEDNAGYMVVRWTIPVNLPSGRWNSIKIQGWTEYDLDDPSGTPSLQVTTNYRG